MDLIRCKRFKSGYRKKSIQNTISSNGDVCIRNTYENEREETENSQMEGEKEGVKLICGLRKLEEGEYSGENLLCEVY